MVDLNEEQQQTADKVLRFLLSKDKYCLINGSAGTGKTTLVQHLINKTIPEYEQLCKIVGIKNGYEYYYVTATTNKACSVLEETLQTKDICTIHSLLGLSVGNDYTNGKTSLYQHNKKEDLKKAIVFIDEASMVNKELFEVLDNTDIGKVIFIGDSDQLPPIEEKFSSVFSIKEEDIFSLNTIMRTRDNPYLEDLNNQFKKVVKTGVLTDIKLHKGVIEYLEPDKIEKELSKTFKRKPETKRILCFTNNRVIKFNNFVHKAIFNDDIPIHDGCTKTLNTAVHDGLGRDTRIFKTDSKVYVNKVDEDVIHIQVPPTDGSHAKFLSLSVYICDAIINDCQKVHKLRVFKDYKEYKSVLDYLSKIRLWNKYFTYKDFIADLRDVYASTIHKAQGMTLDTVYIDLNDLNTCFDKELLHKLLYVAISRATKRVVFFGRLHDLNFIKE